MNAKQFKNISIRGRMAFAICCFENAIVYFSYNKVEWQFLTNKFWKYTNMRYLDQWHMEASEYQADAILEEISFTQKKIEHLSADEYYILRVLYKKANKEICNLSSHIFYLGTVDLYGALVNFSPNTLRELQDIIDIMESNKIPMPSIDYFEKFKFSEVSGWGDSFNREDLQLPPFA